MTCLAFKIIAHPGQYSRKAFERLGFSVAAEINYADYVSTDSMIGEEDDRKIFRSISSHRCVTLLTKRIFAKQESIDEEVIKTTMIDEAEGSRISCALKRSGYATRGKCNLLQPHLTSNSDESFVCSGKDVNDHSQGNQGWFV